MDAQDYFSKVEDPRVVGRCKHKLSDILIIALASYLCGGEDYESMHELCLERGESLRPLVELPNGCPSVDTFERLLQRIEPQSLYACLQVYGKELISDLEGKHIAIDGKRLKGSKKKTGSTHILSAWVDEVGLSLAQEPVAEKRNELQAIPEVLDSLDLSGAVVSIDAMGTQTHIAEQIIQSEADYILSLKRNQNTCMRMFRIALQDNTRLITMRPWRKIMVVLRSEPIPHYRLQRFLTRGNIVNGKA